MSEATEIHRMTINVPQLFGTEMPMLGAFGIPHFPSHKRRRNAPRYATTDARRHASWILTTCSIHYLNLVGSSSCSGKTVFNFDNVVTRSTKKNTITSIMCYCTTHMERYMFVRI